MGCLGEESVNATSILLLLSALMAADPAPIQVRIEASSRAVELTPLHFGANVEYHGEGIYRGTLPEGDPDSRRAVFAEVVRRSGLRSLRFPGGNCSYWYLYDSEEATRKLTAALKLGTYAPKAFQNRFFTRLDHFLEFCRENNVEPIVQLPTLFFNDGGQPRAVLPSTYSERAPKLYDHDRIEEATAYIQRMVAWTKERGFEVKHWEIGNEEFAHCEVEPFARLTVAYAKAIRDVYPDADLYVTMMHWGKEFLPLLKKAGLGGERLHFTTHYPFGSWYLRAKDVDTSHPANYVMANMGYEKNYRASDEGIAKLGWPDAKRSATETATIRFPQSGEHSWDPHAIIPSYAHALAFTYNWSVLISRPSCNVATFHDLESTYFGLMKYDVYHDPANKRYSWIPPDWAERPDDVSAECWFDEKYVVGPSALAMGLLAELEGLTLLDMNVQGDNGAFAQHAIHFIAGASEDECVIVALNRLNEARTVQFTFAPDISSPSQFEARTLTADSLRAVLPNEFRISDSSVPGPAPTITMPPYSVTMLRGARNKQ